jgi:hypothetical protein
VQLKSKHLLEARVLVNKHVIESLPGLLAIPLLVDIVLDIGLIRLSLEGVPAD